MCWHRLQIGANRCNYFDAAIDGAGILLDAVALALPVVPAGVRTVIKTARAADKAIDATKMVDKASDTGKATRMSENAAKGKALKKQVGESL